MTVLQNRFNSQVTNTQVVTLSRLLVRRLQPLRVKETEVGLQDGEKGGRHTEGGFRKTSSSTKGNLLCMQWIELNK